MSMLFITSILLQFFSRGSTFGLPKVNSRVDPLVDSKVGLIKGLSGPDGEYSMFLGIPYAKVDEDNIFGDSIPYPKFTETFEAYDDSAICPQVEEFNNTIVGNLDCLHLNVFVPSSATSSNRLPVLVWIHGGALEFGFYNRYLYGPQFLVRHDIILVTINYRLGPYGFMCPDIPDVSGNQGLKDQLTALRWVKENIEAFGGDVQKITIFGESAGGASVDFHLYSNEENLFQKAIMQSGVALISSLISNPGIDGPLRLAGHLGLVTDNVREALSFLATVDTELVIAASNELGLSFRACIENISGDTENIIIDYPLNLDLPRIKNIPLLIGFNSDEGLALYGKSDNEYLQKLDIVGQSIKENFDMDSQTFEEMFDILKHFYFGDKDVSEETRRPVLDLTTDFMFGHPIYRSIKKYLDNGANTIYSYMFSFVSERNFVKYKNGITIGGAAHADEISYLFDVSYMKSVMSEEEQIMVDRITTLWANFVKYGDPTPDTTDLLPVKWAPLTTDRWNYLNLDSELTLESRPFSERMAFLDLFFKMNEKYLIGRQSDIVVSLSNYENES